MSAVGIDFGTTNSVVAQYSGGRVDVVRVDKPPADWPGGFDRVLPSVFALEPGRQPIFGWRAKRQARGSMKAVKRLFATEDKVTVGGEVFFVEEVAALLFSELRRAALAEGVDFSSAVGTVPANSRGLARSRTKVCAGMAGIEVPALINEPTAAAMAFGLTAADDQNILVVDWGGGTLDVTVLGVVGGIFMEQASKGVQRLGGIDFDRVVADRLAHDIAGASSWDAATRHEFELDVEQGKIRLSDADEVAVPIPGAGRRVLTRRSLEDWVRHLVVKVREPIERCLSDLHMTPRDIDHVLLVGGTCKMPSVRTLVAEIMGRDGARGVDPMTAVGEGAAVAAAILAGEHDSDFFVSTEHALGTVIQDEARRPRFSQLIGRNHKLPARETDQFSPVDDYQESIRLMVIEGDPERPLDHEDNVILRELSVPIEPRPRAETLLDVTYEYDVSGILHVTVEDADTRKRLFAGDVAFATGRDPQDLVTMAGRVEDVIERAGGRGSEASAGPDLSEGARLALERARVKVIPFVPDDDAAVLQDLASQLEEAAVSGDVSEAQRRLEEALRRFSYLY